MKRVFIAFAIEDQITKILFTGHAKNARVPYEFVDMSVKEPWDTQWKTNCRIRIKGCDGTIVLISRNLSNASGALWEIKCSIEEAKPVIGILVDQATSYDLPMEFWGKIKCYDWKYDHIKAFIESL